MKYLFKILSAVIILSSCANPIVEIPIEDIHAHRLFINSNEYSDDELFSVYQELYLNNENLKKEEKNIKRINSLLYIVFNF